MCQLVDVCREMIKIFVDNKQFDHILKIKFIKAKLNFTLCALLPQITLFMLIFITEKSIAFTCKFFFPQKNAFIKFTSSFDRLFRLNQ